MGAFAHAIASALARATILGTLSSFFNTRWFSGLKLDHVVLVVLLRLVVGVAGQLLSRSFSRVKSITDVADARTRA